MTQTFTSLISEYRFGYCILQKLKQYMNSGGISWWDRSDYMPLKFDILHGKKNLIKYRNIDRPSCIYVFHHDKSQHTVYSRPAKTKKTHFVRHGMLMQSYHTRSIRYRILKNIRADDTLDLTFQGHFQGHKVKNGKKWLFSYIMQSCLVLIAVIHATSIRYRTKINMWVDEFSGFNVQGHLQG